VAKGFRGTFENRLDKKGRVSVPAEFRTLLKSQGVDGIVAFPSLRHGTKHKALECSGPERLDQMSASIDATKVLPDGTSRLTQLLLGRSRDVALDGEGRIVLPDVFVKLLGLTERVTFVGQGPYFEVWDADAYAAREAELIAEGLGLADQLLANAPLGGAS
jgi:MraZ protein